MEVYVNTKLVCYGPALLRTDNGWITASLDGRFSFTESVNVESVAVRIVQGDTVLFESVTPCDTIISLTDNSAVFNVCLINSSPYNDLSKRTPDSKPYSNQLQKQPSIDFNSIERTLNDDTYIDIEGINIPVLIKTGKMYTLSSNIERDDETGMAVWNTSKPLIITVTHL